MMIKNRTHFALIAGIGFSLFSGLSHTAFENENDTALVITNPSAPARLEVLALIHNDAGFSVLKKNGKINEIPNHLVAPPLRRISQSEVMARLGNNIVFRVQQGSDGEFSLQEGGGLDGGNFEEDAIIMGISAFLIGGGVSHLTHLYTEYHAPQPDMEQQSENYFQHAKLDYIACLLNHPLKEKIEGTLGIPSACLESSKKFQMIEDAIKVRGATRFVENEHDSQQVRLDFNACIHKNPLSKHADGTVGIPSACIKQFNQLKTVVDAMKAGEDTTQN